MTHPTYPPATHAQRRHQMLRAFLVTAATALALAAPALAQEQAGEQKATEDKSLLGFEEIVVLGTPGGGGMRKQDASFAITTLPAAEIEMASPKSTAELFTLVPGVWAESSGGVAGANIDVRGLPGGGDAPFVTISINGAPIYGTEMLSFFENSSIFRIDETIEAAEALRGGPNAVFSNGEPGVTLNFRLRKGGEDTEGRVKYSTSDYSLQRVDAVLSGKLSEGLYYMIGGYFKTSPGIRNAEFNSEKGSQFTINLTKDFERGEISVFARVTDDSGQWYLPMALNTGNDLGTFSQLGNATRLRELQVNANGDRQIFDFAKGRGWDGVVTGINLDFDLGEGWTIRDNASYTKGSADTYGFVPDGSPVQVSALGLGTVSTAGGETLSGTDFVQNYGHWVVLKDLESFTNDISINKIVAGHDITVGYYQATWSSNDFWTLGNFTPVQNIANGDFLEPSIACEDLQAAGSGSGCWRFGLESAGDARSDAIYAADSWQITDDLRIDVGARHEWINLDYTLDTGPGYPDGVRDRATTLKDRAWAYTAAVNYDLNDNTAAFGRFSDGFLFPHFDDIRENNLNVNGVTQWELGLKHSSGWFGVFATAFYNKNDSFESVVGGTVPAAAFKTRAMGIELDAHVTVDNFNLALISTLQDAEIKNSTTPSDVGNRVLRQPNWQVRLSPSYDIAIGDMTATVYGALTAVGKRFSDNANTVSLPGYEKIDAGMTLLTPSGLFFQVHADNLNDSKGLTEGDPRNPIAPNGRPILGRSVRFTVGYDF
ncbi:MAG: TonB-dependent receptor [Pseudomonadota bacterium]